MNTFLFAKLCLKLSGHVYAPDANGLKQIFLD